MKLPRDYSRLWLIPITILIFGISFTWGFKLSPLVAAEDGEEPSIIKDKEDFFVTIFDDGSKTIVKSSPITIAELLNKLNITYSNYDIIEPALDSTINSDDFYINIFRARPVILKDGSSTKYAMTAARDTRSIFEDAGIAVYDGDEISSIKNSNLMEAGLAESYEIRRNGGRQITVSSEIPFTEQTVKDYNIPVGSSEVRQLGITGSKTTVYTVNYIDGKEVSREVISEEITKEPTPRIVAVGARQPVPPEWESCAAWAKEAGVSDADLYSALTLIYHESGCRVSAQNSRSGAYGIPQALPGSKMASAGADWETNPVTQIRWMIDYVNGRYGGWQQALNWWDAHHWY